MMRPVKEHLNLKIVVLSLSVNGNNLLTQIADFTLKVVKLIFFIFFCLYEDHVSCLTVCFLYFFFWVLLFVFLFALSIRSVIFLLSLRVTKGTVSP